MYTSQHSLQISRERARPAAGRLALSRSLGSRATLGHGFYGTMNHWMFEMFSHFWGLSGELVMKDWKFAHPKICGSWLWFPSRFIMVSIQKNMIRLCNYRILYIYTL